MDGAGCPALLILLGTGKTNDTSKRTENRL